MNIHPLFVSPSPARSTTFDVAIKAHPTWYIRFTAFDSDAACEYAATFTDVYGIEAFVVDSFGRILFETEV